MTEYMTEYVHVTCEHEFEFLEGEHFESLYIQK